MTGAILLGVVGVFVLTQVLGGNALGRLGITGQAQPAGPSLGDLPRLVAPWGVGGAYGGGL
jgi:hypothetical protein